MLDKLLKEKPEEVEDHLLALYLRSYAHAVLKDADKSLADLKAARAADPEGRWGYRASLILETVDQMRVCPRTTGIGISSSTPLPSA